MRKAFGSIERTGVDPKNPLNFMIQISGWADAQKQHGSNLADKFALRQENPDPMLSAWRIITSKHGSIEIKSLNYICLAWTRLQVFN